MILKEEKIVFVHINKCAGSSVEVFFNEYPRDQHWTMKEYESKIKNWDDIDYVFTVVRNPWDRLFHGLLGATEMNFGITGIRLMSKFIIKKNIFGVCMVVIPK